MGNDAGVPFRCQWQRSLTPPVNRRRPSDENGPIAAAGAIGIEAHRLTSPYSYGSGCHCGGTSPKKGFDCSGFVQYVFATHGTRLPRTSRQQASSGQRLRPVWSALRPGDLVLFAEPGRHISHVATYAGRRRIIHATSSGGRVRYDALDTKRGKWFVWHLVAARRVSPRGASLVFSDGSADRWSGP
jgi:cell wall-associated NlpC family hydrolase